VHKVLAVIIEFNKRKDGRTVLRCIRDDGSVTWQRNENQHARFFPLHDLTHYAVESVMGFTQGFFGLIAAGWDIEETTGRSPRGRLPDEALEVEHLVSLFAAEWNSGPSWSASDFNEHTAAFANANRLPPLRSLSDEEVVRVRERFNELVARWRELPKGETLQLSFAAR